MTETPPEDTPEPEQSAPAESDESPFEPFETQDFLGSDDFPGNRLDLSNDRPGRGRANRER